MTDKSKEEKVQKAIKLLKETGINDLVIVGKGEDHHLKVTHFQESASSEDVAEVQGYLSQIQTELTAMELTSSYDSEEEEE